MAIQPFGGYTASEYRISPLPLQMDDMEEQTRKHRGLDDLEGEIISGRYQIVRRIGKGGMGVVYLATQTNLGRNVCLKVLNPALLDDEDAVGRFEREAKGLSRLQHPNIVTIFDYGRDGNLAYIVMEYAQGETLSKYLKAHGALTLDEFLPLAVQTLKGIGEAHKLGLIHRDIKPANIVLCELEGEKNYVKILDFGLAKLAQGGEELTKEQQLVGSASYMSPEQILTGTSDTRTDVYALGVMFYLMLSGRKPFTGSNDNVILYKHVNEMPTPLKRLIEPQQGVPDTLCEVIDQCLSKAHEKRPQTANDLLNAISYALDAPQLRAGFSSMSLASVELQKSEPFTFPPVADAPKDEEQPKTNDQAEQPASEGSADKNNGVRMPLHAPTVSYQVSTETKDRRVLILVLACVAAIIAIIIVVILGRTTAPQPVPTIVQTQQNAQDEDITADPEDIQAPAGNDAPSEEPGDQAVQDLADTADAQPDSDELSDDVKSEISVLLHEAHTALQNNDQEKAQEACDKILKLDPENEEAKNCTLDTQPEPESSFDFDNEPADPAEAAEPSETEPKAEPAPKPKPKHHDSDSKSTKKHSVNKSGSKAKLLGF